MPTGKQDKEFVALMEDEDILKTSVTVSTSALDVAITWIDKNLDPDDVFDEKKLSAWAEANGYAKTE